MGDPLVLTFTSGSRKGTSVAFPSERFVVGSGPDCGIRLDEPSIRAHHVEVHVRDDGLHLRDVSGAGLLSVDGVALSESLVQPGARLLFAEVGCVVERIAAGAIEATAASAGAPQPPTERGLADSFLRAPGAGEVVVGGRYRLLERIAGGGMGEVFRAEHLELGRPFALKVMRRELSLDPDFVARFKREAVAASRIGHPNIIDIVDFGQTDDGRFYFAMELLDGLTLGALVQREGALAPARAVRYALQVAQAVAAAHHLGVVHRDLKPDNVMVVVRPPLGEVVKVLDFGIAKLTGAGSESTQTTQGVIIGTPQYMSPEQAAGLNVDARADLYALGLILYELLAGHPAFSGQTPAIVMSKQINVPPPPLPENPATPLPPLLAELVLTLLSKDPGQRPASMDAVVVALTSLSRASATVTVPTRAPARLRTGPRVVAALAAAAALAALAFFVQSQVAQQPATQPAAVQRAVEPRMAAPPAVTTAKPAEPQWVSRTIVSTPPGASVFEGDTLLGKTPLPLRRVRTATAALRLTLDDHRDEVRSVRFDSEADVGVELQRAPQRKPLRHEADLTKSRAPLKPAAGLKKYPD
jgi:serine/threonine-protein kinase